jgi:predicted secreted protein
MTFTIGLMVYVMIWVVVLFLVLPWGVRIPDKVEPGHATSAPEHPYIGLKLLVTSVLSALLWVVAYLILKK